MVNNQEIRYHDKARNVLITGASRGLGAQLALSFAKRGDRVVGVYRTHDDEAQALVHRIQEAGGNCELFKVDIGVAEELKNFFEVFKNRLGKLDILINNAAIVRDQVILRMSSVEWDEVIRINLKGAFLCIKESLPLMRGEDPYKQKSILNIASFVGLAGNRGQANYAASKAALLALTRVAALELAPLGIRVNAVIPGLLRTSLSEGTKAFQETAARPLEETAQWILLLTGLKSVSGQVFTLEDRILNDANLHQPTPSCRDGSWPLNFDWE